MMDPELDYQLMRVCKQMIKVRSSDTQGPLETCVFCVLKRFTYRVTQTDGFSSSDDDDDCSYSALQKINSNSLF